METSEILSAYLDDYFEHLAGRTYRDLRGRQGDLLASLAFGAAGVAYACWYTGVVRGDEALLDEAGRWLRSAERARHGARAFLARSAQPGTRMPQSAFLYGAAGLFFLRALLAHSRGERRARELALTRFAALAQESQGGSAELYKGSAGCLAACAILLHGVRDRRLLEVGDGLARHLAAVLAERAPGELDGAGFAHGRAGLYHALLLWSEAAGARPEAGTAASLTSFLEDAVLRPERFCPRPARYAWLCSGFPGLTVLAAKAHTVLGQPGLLAAGRQAAQVMLAHPPATPDLCCGRAGVAFACLALAQADPAGPWEGHARDYAFSALLCEREDWARAGLYNGEASVPCLAANLLLGLRSGPPCLDLVTLPAP